MQKTQTDRLECGHWLKPRQNVTNVPLLSFSAPRYSVYDTGLFESSVNGIWILYSPLLSFLYRHETSPELGSSQTASVFLTNAKQPPKEKKNRKKKKKVAWIFSWGKGVGGLTGRTSASESQREEGSGRRPFPPALCYASRLTEDSQRGGPLPVASQLSSWGKPLARSLLLHAAQDALVSGQVPLPCSANFAFLGLFSLPGGKPPHAPVV